MFMPYIPKKYIWAIPRISLIAIILIGIFIGLANYRYAPKPLDVKPYIDWVKNNFHRSHYDEPKLPIVKSRDEYYATIYFYTSYDDYGNYKTDTGNAIKISDAYLILMQCYTSQYHMSYYCYLQFEGGSISKISIASEYTSTSMLITPREELNYKVGDVIPYLNQYDGLTNKINLSRKKRISCINLDDRWRIYLQDNYCHNILMSPVKSIGYTISY